MGRNKTFLVTGGGGQLGRAFARLLPEAHVLGRSELDISDPGAVERTLQSVQPDYLINAAAYTAVDKAEQEPDEAHRINVGAVIGLARAAKAVDAQLVHFSSDYVYKGNRPGGYSENDRTVPLSTYGRTKLQGEVAARSAGARTLILRTSWVFGWGNNFVRSIVGAAGKLDELQVVDDQRGRPTYAPDLAEGVLALIDAGAEGLYNLTGGGRVASWADVAEAAIEAAGLKAAVQRVSTEQYYASKTGPIATRPLNSELDCSRAAQLGVTLRPWEEAVTEFVAELMEESD